MQSWIGLTVAQVLAACGTPFGNVTMVDEPPGKLRALEFECRQGAVATRYLLEFEYHAGLFSAQRDWAESLVGRQKVTGVGKPVGGAIR